MNYLNDDLRIKEIKELLPPVALLEKFPATERAAETVSQARNAIHQILRGSDDRLLVVIGPCSIHDTKAAKEYAGRLLALRQELSGELEVVMRVYFEKPRTTVGWKGLINDPQMDNSFQINDGLRLARKLLLDINDSGLPAAGEFLDMITPAVSGGSDELGRDRRTHHGISGAPRTVFRFVLPGRLQKRHRRYH
ncbi:Phospho-2-dehydro-3-deoxyheptonate aldolase, Phe-sensitive [Serratia quinivorans]|uniref:3-deoxy-7-phosphoheptulonate synthase n=1 Tax=Serratia quinivorans TaxID=137545 RepID=A0A379YS13_9GAMM|nr:Phospho-2-dehydro-3-deoxyheptonate aldolase, Phe-sensitive [Serratia quinivorans]